MGHARAVAAAPDPEELTKEVIAQGLSVRQAEQRAKASKPNAPQPTTPSRPRDAKSFNADVLALERQLGDTLGLRVQISHNGQKGTVALSYSSLDQLDMLCQRLTGEPI